MKGKNRKEVIKKYGVNKKFVENGWRFFWGEAQNDEDVKGSQRMFLILMHIINKLQKTSNNKGIMILLGLPVEKMFEKFIWASPGIPAQYRNPLFYRNSSLGYTL